MNIADASQFVAATKPSLLYISGKTCTGKTTFSQKLAGRDGYAVIVLDKIVREAVTTPLGLQDKIGDVVVSVYQTADVPEWVDRFVDKTRERIAEYRAQEMPVIIEGAVSNPEVLTRIFAGYPDAQTLYFHLKETGSMYPRNLLSRFMGTSATNDNGLPNAFWDCIKPEDFAHFCKDGIVTPSLQEGIDSYCAAARGSSAKRLALFQQHLQNLQVVEI